MTTPPPGDDDFHVRPFADWLRDQSDGNSHAELGDGLHELIARVKDTGKKGRIIYSITVEMMKDSDRMVVVHDEIKVQLPEFPRKASIFYTDRDGNLVRNDPHQLTFESLREVPPPRVPAGVDPRTGEVTDLPSTATTNGA